MWEIYKSGLNEGDGHGGTVAISTLLKAFILVSCLL
jgi:hypothetical protein